MGTHPFNLICVHLGLKTHFSRSHLKRSRSSGKRCHTLQPFSLTVKLHALGVHISTVPGKFRISCQQSMHCLFGTVAPVRTCRQGLLARCWLPPWTIGDLEIGNASTILIAMPSPGRRHADSNSSCRLCKGPHTSITALETSSAKSSSVPVKLAAEQRQVQTMAHLPASKCPGMPKPPCPRHIRAATQRPYCIRHIRQAFRESTRAGRSFLPCAHPPASCHGREMGSHGPLRVQTAGALYEANAFQSQLLDVLKLLG